MSTDYALEKSLIESDPELHNLFSDTVLVMQNMLSGFKRLFPAFTDHSALHSLQVIDFCNQLIGPDNLQKMSPDAIYVLLASCYLHDSGMAISEKEYEELKDKIPVGDYYETHKDFTIPDFVRDFHHEFSGLFIEKYADFLEIPTKEHLHAIIQVSRGHRKTDLLDHKEYPPEYKLPNGNTVCLPYLASLIRLADEIHVAATRNPVLLYDIESLTEEKDIREFMKDEAVKRMVIRPDSFDLYVRTDNESIMEGVRKMSKKMQQTLDYCRKATNDNTQFVIRQSKVILNTE